MDSCQHLCRKIINYDQFSLQTWGITYILRALVNNSSN